METLQVSARNTRDKAQLPSPLLHWPAAWARPDVLISSQSAASHGLV